jgi:ubiquinone/menaquinone biosynthesis C-methylase UbiE
MHKDNPAMDYETYTVPARFMPLIPSLLETARPEPGESVLDVGCGTGVVARSVAPLVRPLGHVIGIDTSPNMLAIAREISVRDDLQIEWIEGDARQMPFPDGAFDLALCQQTLQFIPDKPAVLSEIRRVLSEGRGRLVLNVWLGLDHHPFPRRFYEVLGAHLNTPLLDQAYSLGDETVLAALLDAAGFRDVSITVVQSVARFSDPERYVGRQVASSIASNPAIHTIDAVERAQLVASIEDEMQCDVKRFTKGSHLVLDQFVYLVHGRR